MGSRLLIVGLCLVLAVPGGAQVSSEAVAWGSGPASFLFTEAERAEWGAVADDAAAVAFVARFWDRRDPTPETPDNEALEEFRQRVAFADRNYSTAGLRGSMSDPGRTLVVLGPPSRVKRSGWRQGGSGVEGLDTSSADHHPSEGDRGHANPPPTPDDNPFAGEGGSGVPMQSGSFLRETWFYEGERAPRSIGRPTSVGFRRPIPGAPLRFSRPEKTEALLAFELLSRIPS